MEELDKLKKKIAKDKEQSQFRISQLQKEIQTFVKERKELRESWETADSELEGNISETIQEISEIQGRLLQAQELLDYLENKSN